MNNFFLFLITLFCWSPTWYLIKFQFGVVDPLISIFYRFFIASIIVFIFLILFKKKNSIQSLPTFKVFTFRDNFIFPKLHILLSSKYIFNKRNCSHRFFNDFNNEYIGRENLF